MAYNGSGTFSIINTFVYDTVISETDVNQNFTDIATGLSTAITKDGQTTITANIPFATNKITGLGDGTAAQDAAALHQLQDQDGIWCGTAGGTANALTLTPSPAITAYATGQKFVFQVGASPSSSSVTVAVSGLTTKAIEINDAALSASVVLEANKYYSIIYDGTAFQASRLSPNAGDTSGPGSSTDNALARFDGTGGKTLQNSGWTLDDSDVLTAGGALDMSGSNIDLNGGAMVYTQGSDIASASPLVLGTDGNYFDVTGTTGFSAITVAAGTFFMLQFDGALVITHGASIDLPGESNITTAAGDRLIGFATTANTVQVLSYFKADGTAVVSSGGGAMELITTVTPSAVASQGITSFVNSGSYDSYFFQFTLLPATDGADLYLRLSTDGGATYESTADYGQSGWQSNETALSFHGGVNLNQITMFVGVENTASVGGVTGQFTLHNPDLATTFSLQGRTGGPSNDAQCEAFGFSASGVPGAFSGTDIDAVQFLFSSGNITSGTIHVYGIKNA